jgi:hypothetical protein
LWETTDPRAGSGLLPLFPAAFYEQFGLRPLSAA